ncbi:MAG: M56 family metallopeptidase [Lachnospiraceae bacterium]|nr:M56 family metallopeptidase [Lachnospiraceae bacterium]
MISVAWQFLLNVLYASVSVGGVFLLLKIFSQWMDGHFNLKWKKLLYLFLTIRLLIPINMQIPYYNIKTDNLTRDIVDFSGKAETDINNYSKNFLLPLNINIEAGHYKISVHAVLFFIWVIGFLIYFVFTFTGYIINRHKILQYTITANNIRKVAINICEEIGLNKIPVILYSPIEISPMVLGMLKPILLLPEIEYSDEEIYFILKHELIHLKQKDNIYKYILQLANAVHWFNPLVYMFVSEASLNLEFLCDEEVVKNSSLDMKKRYTYTILNSASKAAGPPLKYFTKFQENKKIMKKRFRNIIKKVTGNVV